VTVAEDGSVNARPMGPQKSPASEDPFGILFLTRRGSRKALEIGRTGRLSVVYQHDADDSYVTLIGRGVIIADRALLRARWQPAWKQFFPAGADDETSSSFSSKPTASSSGCLPGSMTSAEVSIMHVVTCTPLRSAATNERVV